MSVPIPLFDRHIAEMRYQIVSNHSINGVLVIDHCMFIHSRTRDPIVNVTAPQSISKMQFTNVFDCITTDNDGVIDFASKECKVSHCCVQRSRSVRRFHSISIQTASASRLDKSCISHCGGTTDGIETDLVLYLNSNIDMSDTNSSDTVSTYGGGGWYTTGQGTISRCLQSRVDSPQSFMQTSQSCTEVDSCIFIDWVKPLLGRCIANLHVFSACCFVNDKQVVMEFRDFPTVTFTNCHATSALTTFTTTMGEATLSGTFAIESAAQVWLRFDDANLYQLEKCLVLSHNFSPAKRIRLPLFALVNLLLIST